MNRYAKAAAELRELHAILAGRLAAWEAAAHRNLKQVAPGVWIHKDYKYLSEALADLEKMLS